MDKCKGCTAEIVWVKTAKGKDMPVDPEWITVNTMDVAGKVGDGRLVRVITHLGRTVTGSIVPKSEADQEGRIPHWVTCPQREQFRRRASA